MEIWFFSRIIRIDRPDFFYMNYYENNTNINNVLLFKPLVLFIAIFLFYWEKNIKSTLVFMFFVLLQLILYMI